MGSEDMAKVRGGWWIFGWGGEIGNVRRQPDDVVPGRETHYPDGRRVRDYRDDGPQWPTVD